MILAVTPGDPEGIGPEIIWKTIRRSQKIRGAQLLCVGAPEPFRKLKAPIVEVEFTPQGAPRVPKARKSPFVWLLPTPSQTPAGKLLPGFQSGWAIETATRLVQQNFASALVTGPISKERLQAGGYPYPGHTEFLAELCRTPQVTLQVTMMLANDQLRVTLVTTHVGLAQVSQKLSAERIRRCVEQTAQALHQDFSIRRPKIAVAALNPHAGESGLFGREEIDVIIPELERLRSQYQGKFELIGPMPADTLFAKNQLAPRQKRFDAVVCMYHDQGLIPVKLLDFPNTVNVTLGLPIVRTSVDHGVGFDIASKGIADPSSFQAAVRLAIQIVRNRSPKRKKP
jgi:4-hydroxythreonine-4-phosphate dehydrogenase